MDECYMCEDTGTTREHVPPYSFHPTGYRDHLITVPSCEKHNLGNALDVEAVRNFLPLSRLTNEVGLALVQGAVIRSFERSPGLTRQTLGNLQSILINGEETDVFPYDLPRFKHLMASIAYGMYFHIFKQRFPYDWKVFVPGLIARQTLLDGSPDGGDAVRQLLAGLSYSEIMMPQPLVFQCGLYAAPDAVLKVFRFAFYGGNVVYAFTKLPD